jgi:hypothetical protein
MNCSPCRGELGVPGCDEIRGGDGIDEIRDTKEEPFNENADYNNKLYGGVLAARR